MGDFKKVAVVGYGGVFPDCKDTEEFKEKMFSDQSLIRTWPESNKMGKQTRSKVSGYVSLQEQFLEAKINPMRESQYPDTYIDQLKRIPDKTLSTCDVSSIWAILSATEAINMSGWHTEDVQSERTGVVIGSATGGYEIQRKAWHEFFYAGKKTRTLGPHNIDRVMVYREAANVSLLFKNKGVCEAVGSACATGLGNIGYAYRLIKFGIQDRVICGGVEPTSLETYVGFDAMMVLSRGFDPDKSSRPFDVKRKGFVCSFGAGIIALEEYTQAKKRGANILGVIKGYANNCDGDGDMFSPSYLGQRRLWNLLNEDVNTPYIPDVVKVHGTSTPVGDAVELFSIIDQLGQGDYLISAPKSQFGHMLGGAGSVEFITALLMLEKQKALPCLNSDELNSEPEPIQKKPEWKGTDSPMAAFRNYLPQRTTDKKINHIVCLNYGFGGTNSALLLGTP